MRNKNKVISVVLIVAVLVIALVVALWGVPFAQMSAYRNSDTVQAHAAQLAEAYEEETGESVSPKDICRDLSYLNRFLMYSDTLPTEIAGTQDGLLVYTMPIVDTEVEYVTVSRNAFGTIHYDMRSDDGIGHSIADLMPWGSVKMM